MFQSYGYGEVTTRSIFISYHHDGDQAYYDSFSEAFSQHYGVVRDNSLDRRVDSTDPDYVMRRIRENHITGTSCTIVLCGPLTYQRKYVDWEIKATLDKQHGLIGFRLPNLIANINGKVTVPSRLHTNINSGYTLWHNWSDLIDGGSAFLQNLIESAISRSSSLIENEAPLKDANG